jgi:hypothetical protein
MSQDTSARIAKAKALARAMGLSEQEVVKLAIEQTSDDPRIQQDAIKGMGTLVGGEGNLFTLTPDEVPQESHRERLVNAGYPSLSGPISMQADGVEQLSGQASGAPTAEDLAQFSGRAKIPTKLSPLRSPKSRSNRFLPPLGELE